MIIKCGGLPEIKYIGLYRNIKNVTNYYSVNALETCNTGTTCRWCTSGNRCIRCIDAIPTQPGLVCGNCDYDYLNPNDSCNSCIYS